MTNQKEIRIGMLVFPNVTPIDVLGPFEVLARAPGCTALLVWKNLQPIQGDSGLRILPDIDFAGAEQLDVILVPGGPGLLDLMEDEEVLRFLRTQAAGASWITSVCTGSLLLAAAGLMSGYRSTCYWMAIDQLEQFGVQPVSERVVIDRNRITGAGATSGLDFAFTVLALLRGEEAAKSLQLVLEYEPSPPFNSGHPRVASKELVAQIKTSAAARIARSRTISARAARRLAGMKS